MDDITPLRQVSEAVVSSDAHLFAPAAAYRVQRDNYTDTPLPPDEPAAANPPDGAVIDYYLGSSASGPVKLEILDARGQVVRSYSSADQPEASEADLKKQLIPLYWLRPFRALSAEAGVHRWVWDLHYQTPNSLRHEYPIAAIPGDTPRLPLGPTALPGHYTVRLTANGKSQTAALTVKMDPRVKTPALGLEKKFAAETQLASLVSQTSLAAQQANSIDAQLKKQSEKLRVAGEAVQTFQEQLAALLGGGGGFGAPAAEEPTLMQVNGNASTLYGQIWQVDATPTSAQLAALTTAEHDSAAMMKRWAAFKKEALPELNRKLHEANLPEIEIESTLQMEEPMGDEE
jgi:hypothetical protein